MFKFLISIVIIISYSFVSSADHGPKKMWKRQIVPYFDVHETKMMGPFKINVHAYGEKKNLDAGNVKKENFDNIFKDKFNLATLIRKNNEFVYTRFNKKEILIAIQYFMECLCLKLPWQHLLVFYYVMARLNH